MALSATFTANFSNFYDAVDKADVKLADLGSGAERVSGQLSRMADQFSGKKIVQDAMLMVKAIDGVEGVTKLTEKEMARLGATTNEAVAKLKALGKDVPKDLQAVADATKNANKQTTDWLGGLGKLAATMGIAFSVDAIIGFGASVLELASHIKDLATQWGVSIQGVQQFTGAAKQFGVDATAIGKSLQFLSGELQGNSSEYEALLNNLGLTREGLRKLSTEDAFKLILARLAGIKDEALRLDNTLAVLGPSGKAYAGAIGDGFLDAMAKQKTWSDDQVKRLADAQQTWKNFWDAVTLYTGEAMDTIMWGTETLTKSWGRFFGALYAYAKDPKLGAAVFLIQEHVKDLTEETKKATDATNKQKAAAQGAATTTAVYGGAVLNTALVLEQNAKREKTLKDAEAARAKQLSELKAKEDAYRKTVEAQQKAVVDLSMALSGNGLISQATKYLSALETSIPISKMTAQAQAEIGKAMADAIDVFIAAGEVAPKAMIDIWLETKIARDRVVEFNFSLDELKKRYLDLTQMPKFDPFTVTGQPNVDLGQPPKEDRYPQIINSVRTLTQELGRLGTVTGGAFGEVVTAAADIGWAFDQATTAAGNMKTGIESIKAKHVTEGLTNVAAAGLQVASSFLSATEGAGMMQSILTGAAMGAALAPGPYMGYAAAAGAIVGVLRGFNNMQAEDSAVAQLRGQMLQAIPTSMDFRKEVEAAGYTLEGFANADTIADLKHEYDLLVRAIEANQLRDAYIETAGGVDQLQKAAERANFDITKLMSTTGKDLQAEIDALTEAFRVQDENMNTLTETAERYGFTLAELGPALQGQELDKQAQQLYQDWEVLNAAGLRTVDISNRMGESVSAYVNTAMKLGHEVPNAMKPMLEDMAKAGKLTDENGEAVEDLEKSGIKFSLTMSEGFQRLIGVVEKLTESISISLGLAIKNVPQPKIQGRVSWDIDDPAGAARNADTTQETNRNSFANGTGGFRNFGAGTLAMLHGWEAVVPRSDAAAFAQVASPTMAAAAGPVLPPIIINAQGAFFDTPDSLQRLAGKVSDALTAKHSIMGKLRAAV